MTPRFALQLAALVFSALVGCSWVAEPDTRVLRCELPDAGDGGAVVEVCPAPLRCFQGTCQQCGLEEICGDGIDNDCDGVPDRTTEASKNRFDICGDGLDNNCDGVIDEGSDEDGDGYNWCGDTVNPGGVEKADCNDNLAAVNPGAPELCDGRDNNCNNLVDEGPITCPSPDEQCINSRCVKPSCAIAGSGRDCGPTETCDAATATCVPKGPCAAPCQPGEVCDPVSKACKRPPPLANGAPCLVDIDCLSGACIDAKALRLAGLTRVCGTACCTSSNNCGEGERCVATGTGARSCLPAENLAINAVRQCAATNGCTGAGLNLVCSLSTATELRAPTFSPARSVGAGTCSTKLATEKADGETCTRQDAGVLSKECASGVCALGSLFPVCAPTCGHTADCKPFGDALRYAAGAYCGYVEVAGSTGGEIRDHVTRCIIRPNSAPMTIEPRGKRCTKASDCQEGGCVAMASAPGVPSTEGRCSPTCCSNLQCPMRLDGRPGLCRPFPFGEKYEMRCEL